MSAQLVRSEIQRFLASDAEEVLCIHGVWGVGKTYAWREYLHAATKAGGVALSRYSYVSLFGLSSLNDLKYAIFESTVTVSSSGGGPNFGSLQESLKALEWTGRKGAALLRKLPSGLVPGSQTLTDLVNSSYFLAVRRQIICLDDLERKGASFSLTDVLGLVSQLKEERRCKVVLLLNTNALEGDDDKAFTKYLEKVVDRSLRFAPTSKECAEIALDAADETSKIVSGHVVSLGISNIRVIKRIEYIARELKRALSPYDQEMFGPACKDMVLLAWAYYQPDVAPSLEYLTNEKAKRAFDLLDKGDNLSPEEVQWNAQLDAYGYRYTDDFDLAILEGIKLGYFDPLVIGKHAKPQHQNIVATRAQDAYRDAWTLYHGSFDDDADKVLSAIVQSLRENVRYLPFGAVDPAVELLKRLGRSEEAAEIIRFYVTNRDEEDDRFWDLESYAFGGEISDPDLRDAIRTKHAALQAQIPDTEVLLRRLMVEDRLNSTAIIPLAGKTVEEFYRVFKSTKGRDLPHMIEACLQFRNIGGISTAMAAIVKKATAALEIIGRESPINSRRVARYGIKIGDEEAPLDAPESLPSAT